MDDHGAYPVYFESPGLLKSHERTVERYFRNHRKSGGGDGGPLRKDEQGVYRVVFKSKKDQCEVLKRKHHVVETGSALLRFTVREAQAPHSSPQTSNNQVPSESDGAKMDSASIKTFTGSSPPPSGECHELQLDSYLLHYLKDCPKAGKWLHQELELLHCSAELHPEDESVVVKRRSGDKTSTLNWKTEIDALFETVKNNYTCHFETDPPKVNLLLESSSSQTADEVKVYSEGNLAVVVGEIAQVNTKLNSLPEYFAELDNQVNTRMLSDFNPHLLAFWKKAFFTPGTVDEFDGLCVEVEIKIRETDLQLLSFSATSLDETEKVLRTKFKLKEIPVANVEAIHSLQEKVMPNVRRMNRDSCRVQLDWSDNIIYLVGHAKEVEELYDIVTQLLVEGFEEETKPYRSHSLDLHELSPPDYNPSYMSLQEPHTAHGKVEQHMSSLRLDQDAQIVARYSLSDELEVLVCSGDITKQEADAFVNAANEDLKHSSGVALALSEAGGPEVQLESNVLVENYGKISPGEVVVTSGGRLKCKKLIHAVGPVDGKAGGRERALIKKAITSALRICEIMDFTSIALPCISSGVLGVPVDLCAEAIVSAVQAFGAVEGRSLRKITLIDNNNEVVRSMKQACERLLRDVPLEADSPDIGVWSLEEQTGAAPKGLGEETGEAPQGETGERVRIDFVQGTIETQQVDAVVSPMYGGDPLSTRIGNCLHETVGPQLTDSYSKQQGGDMPGDFVMVDGLTGAPFNAVFFVHLLRWDNDPSGTAVQVMRVTVSEVLTLCEEQGFNSMAFPVLGAGAVFGFPEDVVLQVLLEEIDDFDQRRNGTTPFTVSIVYPPSDLMVEMPVDSIQKSLELPVAKDSETRRIILLGKTGSGKSSLGNTILGEDLFRADDSPNSGTKTCQSQTKTINGRNITLIDTPGLFDSERSEEELMPEILSCLIESTPGPHAFLIVLKVDKFTSQEKAIVTKICQYFSEEALQYATVVFTHGNQLPPSMTIETFIKQNKHLSKLVKKCGNRCHVFDNTYWNSNQPDQYRNNQIQVEALLETIDQMVKGNNWGFYSNEAFKTLEKDIQEEMEVVNKEMEVVNKEMEVVNKESNINHKYMPPEDVRKEAKKRVSNRWFISLVGIGTGAVLGAIFGVEAFVRMVMTAVKKPAVVKGAQQVSNAVGFKPTTRGMAITAAVGIAVTGLVGGVVGGAVGGRAAEDADSVEEAYELAKKAVMNKKEDSLKALEYTVNKQY